MYVKCLHQLMREYVDDDRKVLVLWARKEGDGGRAVETVTGRTASRFYQCRRSFPRKSGTLLHTRLSLQRLGCSSNWRLTPGKNYDQPRCYSHNSTYDK